VRSRDTQSESHSLHRRNDPKSSESNKSKHHGVKSNSGNKKSPGENSLLSTPIHQQSHAILFSPSSGLKRSMSASHLDELKEQIRREEKDQNDSRQSPAKPRPKALTFALQREFPMKLQSSHPRSPDGNEKILVNDYYKHLITPEQYSTHDQHTQNRQPSTPHSVNTVTPKLKVKVNTPVISASKLSANKAAKLLQMSKSKSPAVSNRYLGPTQSTIERKKETLSQKSNKTPNQQYQQQQQQQHPLPLRHQKSTSSVQLLAKQSAAVNRKASPEESDGPLKNRTRKINEMNVVSPEDVAEQQFERSRRKAMSLSMIPPQNLDVDELLGVMKDCEESENVPKQITKREDQTNQVKQAQESQTSRTQKLILHPTGIPTRMSRSYREQNPPVSEDFLQKIFANLYLFSQ
jgi:hypothetical protein